MSFNKVVLIGRLCAEPEIKQTKTGISVMSNRLAVQRKMDRNTADFIDVVFWRQTAEFVEKYFAKGDNILCEGENQTRQWEAKDGSKQYKTEVVVSSVCFVDSKKGITKEEAPKPEAPDAPREEKQERQYADLPEHTPDEDLPF